MRAALISVGVLTLASTASAEPAPTREASAATGFDLGAGSTELSAAAWYAASASWRYGEYSSRADSRGTAAVRLSREPGISVDHQVFVRPYGFNVFQFELENQLGIDLRPALSQRPDLWRRRYSREAFQVDLVGLQHRTSWGGVHFMVVDNGFAWEWQHDAADGMNAQRFSTTADWSPFAFTHRKGGEEDGRFDLIALEAVAVDGARDGVVMETMFPRFTDVPLGPLPVHFDFAYGRGTTGWQTIEVDGEVVSDIDSDDLPATDTPVGRARLRTAIAGVEAEAGVERHLYLTLDTALAIEERATARLSAPIRRGRLTATAFAARTELWTSPVDVTRFETGGAGLALTYPMAGGWQIDAAGEVARSFYATIEADRGLRVERAARVDVILRRELRSWAVAR